MRAEFGGLELIEDPIKRLVGDIGRGIAREITGDDGNIRP